MSQPHDNGPSLMSTFDRVFVINLPTRADRRRQVDAQLKRVGSGLDDDRVTLFAAVRPESRGDFPTIGARGCFESHLGVLAQALADDGDRFLVLEDDADFAADIDSRSGALGRGLAAMPWDMVYGFWPASAGAAAQHPFAPVAPSTAVQTSHFIAISRRAAELALPYLQGIHDRPAHDPAGGAMHVDGAYSWFRKDNPALVTLGASPPIATQRPSRTDVHDLNWYDRIGVLDPVLGGLRQIKARLFRG